MIRSGNETLLLTNIEIFVDESTQTDYRVPGYYDSESVLLVTESLARMIMTANRTSRLSELFPVSL